MAQGLTFQNITSQTVWLNICLYDSSCSGEPFRKNGWWSLAPGASNLIWNVDLRTVNQYFYYEAEFAADVTVWGGGYGNTEITDNTFDQCYTDQTGCDRWISYNQLDFSGLLGLTVQLGPKGGQVNLIPTYPHSDHSDHSDGGWFGGS